MNICGKLNLSSDVEDRAGELFHAMLIHGVGRSSPKALASACVYLSAMTLAECRSQADIRMAGGCCEPILRKHLKIVSRTLNLNVPWGESS